MWCWPVIFLWFRKKILSDNLRLPKSRQNWRGIFKTKKIILQMVMMFWNFPDGLVLTGSFQICEATLGSFDFSPPDFHPKFATSWSFWRDLCLFSTRGSAVTNWKAVAAKAPKRLEVSVKKWIPISQFPKSGISNTFQQQLWKSQGRFCASDVFISERRRAVWFPFTPCRD